MSALKLTMTTAGLGRFTAAQADEDIDLTIARVGLTESVFVTAPTLTALPGEFRRIDTVSGSIEAGNIVHLTVTDAEALRYAVRGFGLFLADGTLFAVYGQNAIIAEKSVGSTLALAIDIAFPEVGIENIAFGDTNFLSPPATTETAGVIRIATAVEALDPEDNRRAITPAVLIAAMSAMFSPGMIMLYHGEQAPEGWAICDGRNAQRSDGTAIVMPDYRDRVPVGASDAHPLGSLFGEATYHGHTTGNETGLVLNYTTSATYAGNGTQVAVAAGQTGIPPSLTDNGHGHDFSVDVRQPAVALHIIMKV